MEILAPQWKWNHGYERYYHFEQVPKFDLDMVDIIIYRLHSVAVEQAHPIQITYINNLSAMPPMNHPIFQ